MHGHLNFKFVITHMCACLDVAAFKMGWPIWTKRYGNSMQREVILDFLFTILYMNNVSFVVCTPHQILFQWSDKEERDGRGIFYVHRAYIVIYFYSKTNQMHQCIKLFCFGMTLYVFRTAIPSIIRSSNLYTQQQAYVKHTAVCLLAGTS